MGNDELERLMIKKNQETELKHENAELKLLFLDMKKKQLDLDEKEEHQKKTDDKK